MYGSMRGALRADLEALRTASTFKNERVILSPQGTVIEVAGGPPDAGGEHVRAVTNFCANNYLGLANDHRVVEAAHAALERWGFGTSSVRFICGTFAVHKELEERLSEFLGTEDTILFSSSTRTAASSDRCSEPKTRSSRMRSTTRRSSTAFA